MTPPEHDPDGVDAAALQEYHDRFVEVEGLRLHYTEWNPGGADCVVLIHGMNVQCHTWDPIAAELAKRHRVICPDLRGHGDSDWSRAGYWTADFVRDLAALVDHVGVQRFVLVGHSLGARIGIAFAGEHPDRVSKLVLSDTGPETPPATAKARGTAMSSGARPTTFRDHDAVYDFYRAEHPEWRDVFVRLHAAHQVRRNWADKLVLKADPDLVWIMRGAGLRDVPYLWSMAARIEAPTQILWGATSQYMTEELVGRMEATIPSSVSVRFETGHYIPREAPEQFLAAVTAFVAED